MIEIKLYTPETSQHDIVAKAKTLRYSIGLPGEKDKCYIVIL